MLIHSCCGPCSSSVLERLIEDYDVDLIYYNPNIHPKEEYEKRKSEQIRLLSEAYPNVKFIDCDYDDKVFFDAVKGYEHDKEGGNRCAICFDIRLNYVARKAKDMGYDIFATTLSVSPYKNAKLINEIGKQKEKEFGIEYLESDFKKKNGYARSIDLSKKYNLYRQHYCGCKFSFQQAIKKD